MHIAAVKRSGTAFARQNPVCANSSFLPQFVVDGTWTVNTTDPKEKDEGGNENNVLTPESLLASAPSTAAATAAIMNSVSADATTAQLAKDVPLEKDVKEETAAPSESKSDVMPGVFPETPADELNKPVGIDPLPAAAGGLNPVKLAPGEPVPKDLKTADLNSNIKLDPESYEKSDALPGVDPTTLNAAPVAGTMIPESSLPMGTANINSVSANSTTAALAAEVPLEPKVPEVVKESQDKAGVDPEASGIASEVADKEKLEEELKDKVPEAPTTSEGTAGKGTEKSEADKTLLETATATAAGVGAAALAAAVATKDAAVEQAAQLPDSVKEKLPTSVQETIATAPAAQEKTIEKVSPEVPTEVKESITEAGKSPEAAANTEAVEDKKAVEAELLKEVKPVEAVADAPKTEDPATSGQEAPKVVEPPAPAADVPATSEAAPANGNDTTTNGATNGSTAASTPSTPSKAAKVTDAVTPSSAKSDQKKKNRVSGFFGKLKSKLSHKESSSS